MAGFSSRRDLESEIALGKSKTEYFYKVALSNAGTGGQPEEWFTSTGSPGAISFSGSAGVATQLTNTASGALSPLSEGNVSTDKRYLLDFRVSTSATTISPGMLYLVDMLLYYPSCTQVSPVTTLDNTATLPRYTSGDGVQIGLFIQTAMSGSPQVTTTYTDNSGNSRTATAFQNLGLNPPTAFSNPAVGFGMGHPWACLVSDGARKVESYSNSGNATGTTCFILYKPLACIPINAQSITTETDFVSQFTSFPEIKDGACLGLLLQPGGVRAASSVISGSFTYGWG
jgi:hypothetical protein